MKKYLIVRGVVLCGMVVLAGCQKKDPSQPVVEDDLSALSERIADSLLGEDADDTPADQKPATRKRYTIPAATIVYTYSGMQNGEEIMVFDQYGLREAKYASLVMEVGSYVQETERVSLYLNDEIITYNTKDRTGTRLYQPNLGIIGSIEDAEEFDELLIEMGGVQSGTKNILGKTCDIWEMDQLGTVVCLRNGLMLESQVGFMGQSQYMLATSFDEGPVDESVFVVPDDIDFSSSQAAQDMMNQFFDEIE